MGAAISKSSSKNTIDQLNEIITNVIISNASSCASTAAVVQEVNLGNIGGNLSGVDISASTIVNLDCLQSSINDSKIQSEIAQKLSQFAKSKSEAGGSFFSASLSQSESENISRLANNIANNVRIDNVKQCVASSIVRQKLSAGDIAGDVSSITLSVSSQTISKCIQTDQTVSSSVNELSTVVDQKAETDSLAGFSTTVFAIVAAIILFLCSSSSALVAFQKKS